MINIQHGCDPAESALHGLLKRVTWKSDRGGGKTKGNHFVSGESVTGECQVGRRILKNPNLPRAVKIDGVVEPVLKIFDVPANGFGGIGALEGVIAQVGEDVPHGGACGAALG